MKLVTVAEMRALEQAAVAAGTSEAQLMEEAGLAVAQEAWMMLGSLEGRRIVVLAGPGNNGGDGLVAARHLADWGAEVVILAPQGRAADSNRAELEEREVTFVEDDNPDVDEMSMFLGDADLILDGLLGIGVSRPIDGESSIGKVLRGLKAARRRQPAPKLVAIDLPSGINADNGATDPLVVEPDISVTFGLPKVGMYQAPGGAFVGKVQVIEIGIPREAMAGVKLELLTSRWMRETLPARPEDSNKGTFGKVLVVGGSQRYPGATMLTARGAYRSGAGLVTVACDEELVRRNSPSLAEATWLPQVATEGLSGANAQALRNEWPGYAAAVVGPGMGDTEATAEFLWASLPDMGDLQQGAVIDADALNALAKLDDGAERVPANAILTPHPGEMARLMKTTVAEVQAARMDVARAAAQKYGCVVVLKGAHSVVAGPDGESSLSPFANPLLATAGSGDVLAGMIAGYLAQGLRPFDAAALGVYLHAAAGESLRQRYGEAGALAGEIADELPQTVRELKG